MDDVILPRLIEDLDNFKEQFPCFQWNVLQPSKDLAWVRFSEGATCERIRVHTQKTWIWTCSSFTTLNDRTHGHTGHFIKDSTDNLMELLHNLDRVHHSCPPVHIFYKIASDRFKIGPLTLCGLWPPPAPSYPSTSPTASVASRVPAHPPHQLLRLVHVFLHYWTHEKDCCYHRTFYYVLLRFPDGFLSPFGLVITIPNTGDLLGSAPLHGPPVGSCACIYGQHIIQH